MDKFKGIENLIRQAEDENLERQIKEMELAEEEQERKEAQLLERRRIRKTARPKNQKRARSKSEEPARYEWIYIWTCHSCRDYNGHYLSSGMTTAIVGCPECGHIRCEDCPVETVQHHSAKMR